MKTGKQKIKMYSELAKYYNLIYSGKDYDAEAKKIIALINKYKKTKGKKLLDVACGTGLFLKHLKNQFSCMGIDINPAMLDIALEQVTAVRYKQADMMDFDLNEKFDVVVCLFSSIGYVKTLKNLDKTISNFAKHLNPGGVLIIDPWLSKTEFQAGHLNANKYSDDNVVIVDMHTTSRKGNISTLNIDYLIGKKGAKVKHLSDVHELGLFSSEETISIMEKHGFKVKFYKKGLREGRHLYLGIKK